MMPKNENQELEFLPAALEIQETPPSPVGRAIIGTIILFFLIAVAWAWFGEVDIVAVAQGKIIPNGHSKVIQPLEIGTVRSIHIKEGQEVEKGETLIELDPSITDADLGRLREEAATLEQDVARLQELARRTNPNRSAINGEHARKANTAASENNDLRSSDELQSSILRSQWAEYQSRLDTLKSGDLKKLADKKVVAEHKYLELEQERIEQVHDLQTQQSRVSELAAARNEIKAQLKYTRAEFRRTILQELSEAQRKLAAVKQEIIKAATRSRSRVLVAPVSGVVQQLAVHTVGGIVTPAQELMVIVPKSESLQVEALLENKDIGFVQEGQIAEVKVETFPFTKYGTIAAKIINISNDAIPDENRGLIYKAHVLMETSVMQVGERLVNLSPGMAVTVEIKTGKRRLIEFFLAPLLRYRAESVRER
jgi:hemolysin D